MQMPDVIVLDLSFPCEEFRGNVRENLPHIADYDAEIALSTTLGFALRQKMQRQAARRVLHNSLEDRFDGDADRMLLTLYGSMLIDHVMAKLEHHGLTEDARQNFDFAGLLANDVGVYRRIGHVTAT